MNLFNDKLVKGNPSFLFTILVVVGVLLSAHLYSRWDSLDILIAVVVGLAITAFLHWRGVVIAILGLITGMAVSFTHMALDGSFPSNVGFPSVSGDASVSGNTFASAKGRESGMAYDIRKGALAVRKKMVDVFHDNGMEGDRLAIVSAMALGDKTMINREMRQQYSEAGVAHLLALSGTHLAIVFFMVSSLTVWYRYTVWARMLTLLAIWAYTIVVGLPVSAVRAVLMLSIFSLSELTGNMYDRMDILTFAVFIMVMIDPMTVFDVGFQLSVAAVASILLGCPLLKGLFPYGWLESHRWTGNLCNMACVTFVAQVGTAPIVAYYFGSLPTMFLLTNMVMIPLATILLYMAAIVLLTSWWPAMSLLAARLMSIVADSMNGLTQWVAGLPGSKVDGLHPSFLEILIYYIIVALLYHLIKNMQLKWI